MGFVQLTGKLIYNNIFQDLGWARILRFDSAFTEQF